MTGIRAEIKDLVLIMHGEKRQETQNSDSFYRVKPSVQQDHKRKHPERQGPSRQLCTLSQTFKERVKERGWCGGGGRDVVEGGKNSVLSRGYNLFGSTDSI